MQVQCSGDVSVQRSLHFAGVDKAGGMPRKYAGAGEAQLPRPAAVVLAAQPDMAAPPAQYGELQLIVGPDEPHRIERASPDLLDLFQLSAAECIGRTMCVLSGPDTHHGTLMGLIDEAAALGKQAHAVVTLYSRSGASERFCVSVRPQWLRHRELAGVLLSLVPVGEMRSLKVAAQDDGLAKAIVGVEAPHRTCFCSEEFKAVFGFCQSWVVGRTLSLIHGPYTDQHAWSQLLNSASRGLSGSAVLVLATSECRELETTVTAYPIICASGYVTRIEIVFVPHVRSRSDWLAEPSIGGASQLVDTFEIDVFPCDPFETDASTAHHVPYGAGASYPSQIPASSAPPPQECIMGSPIFSPCMEEQDLGSYAQAPLPAQLMCPPMKWEASGGSGHFPGDLHRVQTGGQEASWLVGQGLTASGGHVPSLSQAKCAAQARSQPSQDCLNSVSTVFPRRKAGQEEDHVPAPVVITMAILEKYKDIPLSKVATKLGISTTAMKKACRKLGVTRWPYLHSTYKPNARPIPRSTDVANVDTAQVRRIFRKHAGTRITDFCRQDRDLQATAISLSSQWPRPSAPSPALSSLSLSSQDEDQEPSAWALVCA